MRSCESYGYLYDLKTDLRKPTSWLDLANMILRRFRLVLVKSVNKETKATAWWVQSWLKYLDATHELGHCEVCHR